MLAAGSYFPVRTRRRVSRLKNKPTRVNERETTKQRRRFSLSTISLGCKIHLPLVVPLPMKGGKASLPLGSHAASRNSSLRPFSSTASSTASSLPGLLPWRRALLRGQSVYYRAPLSEVVRCRPRYVHRGLRFIRYRIPR